MTTTDQPGASAFMAGYPSFANEIVGTLAVQSQYVLHGNIRDYFMVEPPGSKARPMALTALLWQAMRARGYQCFICYDPVSGIRVYPESDPDALAAARTLIGTRAIGRRASLERLRTHLAKVVGVPQQPADDVEPRPGRRVRGAAAAAAPDGSAAQDTEEEEETPRQEAQVVPAVRAAFFIESASRIIRVPGGLDPEERDFFRYCQKLALTARPFDRAGAGAGTAAGGELFNPVFWLVEGERDLPAWLTAGIEPIRTVAVGLPILGERARLARMLAPGLLTSGGRPDAEALSKIEDELAQRTDGMTLRSMTEIARLSVDRGIPADRIADAARIYKLGVDENPWQHSAVRRQIQRGEKNIEDRVIGQSVAVRKTLEILKRSALGLSGIQATSSASRPRGVLFFAGPTGVGKTELAKQISALLFGNVESYLRFDMSEFAAEHAADRLIGAPPGYVGFEAGGELTGAVRRNPFQVVLFDEIEKAHRLVLDKFLQILEDGRLTDGQGVTTYFSECVIIFTSNLGIYGADPSGKGRVRLVHPEEPYDVVEAKVRAAIQEHFTVEIGRPELLNRLGDNIVVFDYIGPEAAARICRLQIENIVTAVEKILGIALEFAEEAKGPLVAKCTENLDNGGRGIGNRLESLLINPLAGFLFDLDVQAGARVEVTSVLPELRALQRFGGRR